MARQIRCPKCKSKNFMLLEDTKKPFSLGKGLVGGALLAPLGFGALGAAGGAIMGKKGKFDLVCKDCGHRWKQKK